MYAGESLPSMTGDFDPVIVKRSSDFLLVAHQVNRAISAVSTFLVPMPNVSLVTTSTVGRVSPNRLTRRQLLAPPPQTTSLSVFLPCFFKRLISLAIVVEVSFVKVAKVVPLESLLLDVLDHFIKAFPNSSRPVDLGGFFLK